MGTLKKATTPDKSAECGKDVNNPITTCYPCWAKDYEKEISVNSIGRYAERYKSDGTKHNYYSSQKYKIYLPLKAGTEAIVEIRFKIKAFSGTTISDVLSAKEKLEEGVKTYWNNKLSLKINDPECGAKVLSIKFNIKWNDSGAHYAINLYEKIDRERVDRFEVNISKDTILWAYAHEYAHCFGLPDEYSYIDGDGTVRYYKPDGTLDNVIKAPPHGKKSNDPSSTIMSTLGNITVLERHGWFFAIEAQELLNKQRNGGKITCEIIAK